jgi:hypothetical protein
VLYIQKNSRANNRSQVRFYSHVLLLLVANIPISCLAQQAANPEEAIRALEKTMTSSKDAAYERHALSKYLSKSQIDSVFHDASTLKYREVERSMRTSPITDFAKLGSDNKPLPAEDPFSKGWLKNFKLTQTSTGSAAGLDVNNPAQIGWTNTIGNTSSYSIDAAAGYLFDLPVTILRYL